ncbi:DegT/DnrJ/EryC1/StrS aminotransferase family protein [Paenibacillus sp. JMULE4]|uniref:DegT/DnrJ/EryC1/StrS aminotransferase family protein n=1 Tax=Paenibacillus sp. JMULE4 TaxID=2518342 RepID=UPI0015771C20|nr:DegT/DnrJ/EryC1/StrS aminotransferase family protein [Paenibacillus sp. JMULE4]NTZ16380.1 DegT/DnrJ/EryC1/StrS aminotransferase family protein [Paenibacillus sp. JMULE4]
MGKLLQNFNGSNLNIEDHSIFLFINYFGKENKTVYDWLRAKPAEKVIFIIEDNVQASLSKDMGKYGDYVVNSFRKMTPLPDGAVVASTKKFDFSLQMPSEEFISKKLVAKHIRDDNEQEHIFFVQNSEEMLDQYIEPRRISWISDFLFDRIDLEEIRMLRRTNWNLLKKALIVVLKDKYEIHTLYSSLEPNEIPLGFPIIVNPEIRNKLRAYLAENNIFCPIHWRLPKKYYAVEFKDDFELSESILTLPIDQRMNEEHINYMVEIIIQFFNKIKGETK